MLCGIFAAASLFALPADRKISQYVRRSWTVEQGLPHGTVRGVAQTNDGYLWLATYEGLVRFNGEELRIFDKASTPAFLNSSVLSLCRARDDTLWIGTVAGVVRYRGGRFEKLGNRATPDELVNAIEEAGDGSVWIGTWGTLSRVVGDRAERIDIPAHLNQINALLPTAHGVWIGTAGGGLALYENGIVQSFGTTNGLANNTVITLLQDGNSILAGTASGLDRIRSGTIEHVAGLPADQITALSRDRDGNLWVGTYSNGLYRVRGNEVSSYGINEGLLNPTVRAIFEDTDGSIWIGSNRGMEQLRAGTFITWRKSDGLSDDFTRAIYEDREGVLWAGTAHGLNMWKDGGWQKPPDARLATAYVLAIDESPDGTHWFGTSNGLYRQRGAETTLLTVADGLPGNGVRSVRSDRNGDVWIATDAGIGRISRDGKVESFANRFGLGTEYGIGIAEARDGRVWIATGGGLAEYNAGTLTLHTAARELPSNRLFGLTADADGTLWIATDGDGLLRYRRDGVKTITSRQGLPYDKIVSLVEDDAGNLWFGTVRGVFRISTAELNEVADGKRLRLDAVSFDESDGLGSRQCNGSGDPAALRTRDGRIWFATANGISALASRRTTPPGAGTSRAPIVESISINGRPVSRSTLGKVPPGAERIEFGFTGVTFDAPERMRFRYRLNGYDDHWVEAGNGRVASYTNIPPGNYTFVLSSSRDGVNWKTTNVPFKLQPHFYQTRWFIGLCLALLLSLLLLIHFARLHFSREREHMLERVVEQRTREIIAEKERTEVALMAAEAAKREAERHEQLTEQALAEAEEANRAKSVFLAATSHELRTPLNAIIGFSDILMSRVSDQLDPRYVRFINNIHSSGEYLLGIINNILDLSKIEAGKMELQPETIILREIVNGICAVMKGVTTLRRISIALQIPSDIPKFEADPTQLKQILYNLMSNAVKFSPEGSTVTVAARHLWPVDSPIGENAVEIRVIDHGIGIDPSEHQLIFQEFRQAMGTQGQRPEGTGLGLALVKRFVEMHHGTVRVESAKGEGSTFVVVLPCRQSPIVRRDDEAVARSTESGARS